MDLDLFELSPCPQMALVPGDLRAARLNALAREVFALSSGESLTPLIHVRKSASPASLAARFSRGRSHFTALLATRRGVRLMEVRAATVEQEGERLVLAAFNDITAMRLGERRLRESFQEARTLLAATALALASLDAGGNVLKWNAQAEKLFQTPRETALGRPVASLIPGFDGRELERAVADCQQERASKLLSDVRYGLPDGKVGFLKITCRPVPARDGHDPSVLVILEDVTQYKILESQLLQSQKLESIGQLAAGIAHEINTPVQYVSGNLGFLKDAFARVKTVLDGLAAYHETLGAGEPLQDAAAKLPGAAALEELKPLLDEIPGSIDDSLDGAERVAAIVGAMKRFSHPDLSAKRLVDVNKAVESILTITKNEWKYAATTKLDLDPAQPVVFCVPGDFNQAVLNVVVNAAHAMDEKYRSAGAKGVLGVRTRSEGRAVVISVSDTGAGIPEAIRERIFDPFFTTKAVGRGTGQGLAIVHSVVTRHGGSVTFESEPGMGTTFHLRFPAGEEAMR
jgi:PAS domain S-box-containing protein